MDGPDFLTVYHADEAKLAAVNRERWIDINLDEKTANCEFCPLFSFWDRKGRYPAASTASM